MLGYLSVPGSTPSEPLTFDNRDRGNDARRRATSEEALKMERRACPGGVGLSPTLRAIRLMRLVLVAQFVVTMRSVGLLPETTNPFRPSSWSSARRLCREVGFNSLALRLLMRHVLVTLS